MNADLLLLLAATIWGFAFVAQRIGMEHVGPLTFNAVRFALGALVLLPLVLRSRRGRQRFSARRDRPAPPPERSAVSSRYPTEPAVTTSGTNSGEAPGGAAGAGARRALQTRLWTTLLGGLAVGVVLFGGSTLQQWGVKLSTAGKAGFITGLYVVFVPLIGRLIGLRTSRAAWTGAVVAAVGLYLLSVRGDWTMATGDLLVLAGALFWAAHVLMVGRLVRRQDPAILAFLQFLACSFLSAIGATVWESWDLSGLRHALVPILYAGIMSVGVAYTLQVYAQRAAPPAHAAIILSLEAVFAALGGWWILGEILSLRALVGCALMLTGMLVSQLGSLRARRRAAVV